MTTSKSIFACSILTAFIFASCQTTPEPTEFDESQWSLTFSDEFDGAGVPDPTKWQSESYNRRKNDNGPGGWWDPDYVSLDGQGNLVLSAKFLPMLKSRVKSAR